ncbi:TetR family transcriptional regulator C-terminal domain-containing protein [Burkholderia ubonensis]|uniref:TetR family transcriptional regulator C-terminal domain-containing protein n=1 Tax=Burkholderia ubonensis TaxID=101571 RepID=UPI000B008EA3|nr:TetR family transcriptional regulator C-terminal domain-containing protein [Burkholderia ubonensis]
MSDAVPEVSRVLQKAPVRCPVCGRRARKPSRAHCALIQPAIMSSARVHVRITIEIGVEATRNDDIAALFAANESLVKGRLAALVERGIAQRRIDRTLKPDLTATWLLALTEGAFMRVASEPGFKMKANTQMLRLIIQRMLRPQ